MMHVGDTVRIKGQNVTENSMRIVHVASDGTWAALIYIGGGAQFHEWTANLERVRCGHHMTFQGLSVDIIARDSSGAYPMVQVRYLEAPLAHDEWIAADAVKCGCWSDRNLGHCIHKA